MPLSSAYRLAITGKSFTIAIFCSCHQCQPLSIMSILEVWDADGRAHHHPREPSLDRCIKGSKIDFNGHSLNTSVEASMPLSARHRSKSASDMVSMIEES